MRLFLYRAVADVIVVVHTAYVAFVLLGFLAILLGIVLRWGWVRNFTFRALHLAAILLVVVEAVCGITCPLTDWEHQLRLLAGEASYRGAFIANWIHELLFFDLPPWFFQLAYTLFGALVLLTFILAPPRRPTWLKRQPAA